MSRFYWAHRQSGFAGRVPYPGSAKATYCCPQIGFASQTINPLVQPTQGCAQRPFPLPLNAQVPPQGAHNQPFSGIYHQTRHAASSAHPPQTPANAPIGQERARNHCGPRHHDFKHPSRRQKRTPYHRERAPCRRESTPCHRKHSAHLEQYATSP
jgi:hypothetical protein